MPDRIFDRGTKREDGRQMMLVVDAKVHGFHAEVGTYLRRKYGPGCFEEVHNASHTECGPFDVGDDLVHDLLRYAHDVEHQENCLEF